jgi:hypothetical protein
VTAENWIRTLNLIGSVAAFYGSYRAQDWLKTQADTIESAAAVLKKPNQEPVPVATPSDREEGSLEEFKKIIAKIAATPLFDRWAYLWLCVAFLITSFALGWDLLAHTCLCPGQLCLEKT